MNRATALLAVLVAASFGCAHLETTASAEDVPFELYQDNQLGSDFSLKRVVYSLDGEPLTTWRLARGQSESPDNAIDERRVTTGSRKFTADATVGVTYPHGEEAEIQLKHVEPLVLVPGRRIRVVFLLCPANRPDPLHAVMTQVDASLMTVGGTRAPYSRGTCLTFEKPDESAEEP